MNFDLYWKVRRYLSGKMNARRVRARERARDANPDVVAELDRFIVTHVQPQTEDLARRFRFGLEESSRTTDGSPVDAVRSHARIQLQVSRMFLENMIADGVNHVRPHLGDRPGRAVIEMVENHLRNGVGALTGEFLHPAREEAEKIVQDLKRRGFKAVYSRTNLDIEDEERDR
jgi:hypothetical protein